MELLLVLERFLLLRSSIARMFTKTENFGLSPFFLQCHPPGKGSAIMNKFVHMLKYALWSFKMSLARFMSQGRSGALMSILFYKLNDVGGDIFLGGAFHPFKPWGGVDLEHQGASVRANQIHTSDI